MGVATTRKCYCVERLCAVLRTFAESSRDLCVHEGLLVSVRSVEIPPNHAVTALLAQQREYKTARVGISHV